MEGKEIIHKIQNINFLGIPVAKIIYAYTKEGDAYTHTVKLQSLTGQKDILICSGCISSGSERSTINLLDKYSTNANITNL